jgi:hypothetical protein
MTTLQSGVINLCNKYGGHCLHKSHDNLIMNSKTVNLWVMSVYGHVGEYSYFAAG